MKILVKETDKLKGSNGKEISEYLVYLMDDTKRPLMCEIVYGKASKNDLIRLILNEHFLSYNNNLDIQNIVEEVSYNDFIKLAKI